MKTKTLTVVFINLLILSSFIAIFADQSCVAEGKLIYVNISYIAKNGNGSVERPYRSIQYAIDVADEGDTICVFGGAYNETLVIDKRLTLWGSVDNGNTVISKDALHRYTVEITADLVIFEGFNITDIKHKNRVALIYTESNNVVLQRNNITHSDTWGIYLDSSHDNTLGGNYINNTKGVYVYSSNNNVISNNNISNSGEAAVDMTSSINNIIYNNSLFNNKYGIFARICNNVNISNNTINSCQYDSIKLYQGNNNIIRYNAIYGSGGSGIDLNSPDCFVRGNKLEENQIGIYLTTSNCEIIDNFINNSQICCGIYAEYGSKNNKIYLNKFIDNYKNAQEIGENQWYNGMQGNYWDDYYEGDRNLDGIGDTHYSISGGGIDKYPLGYFLKPPEKPLDPVPPDNASGVGLRVTLQVDVTDEDSDQLDVFFYDALTGKLKGVDYDVKNGETASCFFYLTFDTPFAWKVVVNDSKLENQSDIWFFTTREIPPENEKPVADPGGPYTAGINEAITFDGSQSYDPDGFIMFYRWNFGDGTSEILDVSPTHRYSTPGTYDVTLTVIDNNGTSSVSRVQFDVSTQSTNKKPVALAGGPYSASVGTTITFDGSKSYDNDGTIANYTWNFGDDTIQYGIVASNSYSSAGAYTVTLTVTDDDNSFSTTSTTVNIIKQEETPGFEVVLVVLAIVCLFFLKRYKNS